MAEKGQARCRAENQQPVCLLWWLLLSRFNWLLFYQETQDSGQDSANHSSAHIKGPPCSASRELAFLLEPPQCPAEPGSICILALMELGGGHTFALHPATAPTCRQEAQIACLNPLSVQVPASALDLHEGTLCIGYSLHTPDRCLEWMPPLVISW